MIFVVIQSSCPAHKFAQALLWQTCLSQDGYQEQYTTGCHGGVDDCWDWEHNDKTATDLTDTEQHEICKAAFPGLCDGGTWDMAKIDHSCNGWSGSSKERLTCNCLRQGACGWLGTKTQDDLWMTVKQGSGCYHPFGEHLRIYLGNLEPADCAKKAMNDNRCGMGFSVDPNNNNYCACGAKGTINSKCDYLAPGTSTTYRIMPSRYWEWRFNRIWHGDALSETSVSDANTNLKRLNTMLKALSNE